MNRTADGFIIVYGPSL